MNKPTGVPSIVGRLLVGAATTISLTAVAAQPVLAGDLPEPGVKCVEVIKETKSSTGPIGLQHRTYERTIECHKTDNSGGNSGGKNTNSSSKEHLSKH